MNDLDAYANHPAAAGIVTASLDEVATDQGAVGMGDFLFKEVPLYISSGLGQTWNGIGTLGNLVIPFADPFKTDVKGNWLLGDTYAGKYYEKHKDRVDTVGFVGSALIPSSIGLKGLKALQAYGKVDDALAPSVGLLTNQAADAYLSRAAAAVARGESSLKYTSAAAGAKGVQFGLEAMAAETVTFAALSQSPIYDDINDVGDFISSVATVGGILGGISGAYNLARRNHIGFQSAALGRQTTIAEMQDVVAGARSDATYFAHNSPNAGRGFDYDENLYSSTSANNLRIGKSSSDIVGTPTAAPALPGQKPTPIWRAGDDVTVAYRAEMRPVTNPFVKGSAEYAALETTLAADRRAAETTLKSYKAEAIAALTPTAGDIRVALQEGLDAMPQLVRDRALNAAKRVQRATVAGNANKYTMFMDLATGELAQKAQVLAHDMGTVKATLKNVTYGDKTVTFTSTNLDSLASRTVDEHNVAYLWAQEQVKADSKNLFFTKEIAKDNLPLLEAMYAQKGGFLVAGRNTPLMGQEALDYLIAAKKEAGVRLLKADPTMGQAELKARLNAGTDFILGKYKTIDGNVINATDFTKPSKVEILYDINSRAKNIWEVKGATFQDLRIRAMEETNSRVAQHLLGESFATLPHFDFRHIADTDSLGGKFLQADATLKTAESVASYVGGLMQKFTTDMSNARRSTMGATDRLLLAKGARSAEMAELAAIVRRVTSSKENLYLRGDRIVNGAGDVILIPQSRDVLEWLTNYSTAQKKIAEKKIIGQRAIGRRGFDPDSLYFAPPFATELKFRNFVVDSTTGNVGMVWANTADELAKKTRLISTEFPDTYKIYTEKDVVAYKKLIGEYDNALDTRGYMAVNDLLMSKGVMSDMLPTSNPHDFLNQIHSRMARQEKDIVHRVVQLKYGQQLREATDFVETTGRTDSDASKLYRILTNSTDTESAWAKFQQATVSAIDSVAMHGWNLAQEAFAKNKGIDALEAHAIATQHGTDVFSSPHLWNLSGMRTWSGATVKAVHEANAFIRLMQLGIDVMQGLIQIAGFPILGVPVIREAMRQGDTTAWSKVLHKGMRDVITKESRDEVTKRAIKAGLIPEDILAYHDLLDAHANLVGAASNAEAARLAGGIKAKTVKLMDKLQTPTALAERFTGVYAYRLGELAAEASNITDDVAKAAYAATFARKVIGNYVMAQRPLAFQGVLGSAVGLFQTYQGTYFQQAAKLTRSPDSLKSLGMMAALQGSIFGLQSLPLFEAANYAVLGQWRDDKSTDAKNLLANLPEIPILGEVGDAVLYGGLSSALGTALWTRGDANPRLPMSGELWNPAALPQIQFATRTLEAMGQWVDSMANGGDLGISTAEAIASANLSRPLTGLAEIASGVRTTRQGLLAATVEQDLLSLSTAMRIAGAKPMHEAIAVTEAYKAGVVQAKEQAELNDVAYALRSRFLADPEESLDAEVIREYAKKYVEYGGNPQGFSRWYVGQLSKATVPRAKALADKVAKEPWAQYYQNVSGVEHLSEVNAPKAEEVKAAVKAALAE